MSAQTSGRDNVVIAHRNIRRDKIAQKIKKCRYYAHTTNIILNDSE
jgi:hypothetical protein